MPRSDYERVIETITERIRSGEYQPGERLPSIAQLAGEFGTSQTTIKSAQMVLRHDGLLRGHPGKGVFVAEPQT
jgi:DNA-binding GntR family transcriptional regulator